MYRDSLKKAWAEAALLAEEYKIVIIAYACAALIVTLVYPTNLLATLFRSRSAVLFQMIRTDALIALPVLISLFLLIFSLFKYKPLILKEAVKSTIALLVFNFITITLLETIFEATPTGLIVKWSTSFMKADKILFGTYPGFWLQSHLPFFLQVTATYVYEYFHYIFVFWLVFLLMYKKGRYAASFLKQLFIATAISLPLWLMVPAIDPVQMYIGNVLHVNDDIRTEVSLIKPPNLFTNRHVSAIFNYWNDPQSNYFAVSCFPSLHTIWGLLIVYSAVGIFRKRWVKALVLILALLNMVGAIYLLAHFAVDIFAGIAVAIISVKIVRMTQKEKPPNEIAERPSLLPGPAKN
jgi:membrane-associated phospholipid phosphatase